MEEPTQEGTLPFLDTLVAPGPNNTLITTVYREPTHTDQYVHWDSNHFTAAKHSVYKTLAHRAKIASTTQESLHDELNHIMKALQECHFPPWALNQVQHKFECKNNSNQEPIPKDNPPNNENNNISIEIPYIHGMGRSSKGHVTTKSTNAF